VIRSPCSLRAYGWRAKTLFVGHVDAVVACSDHAHAARINGFSRCKSNNVGRGGKHLGAYSEMGGAKQGSLNDRNLMVKWEVVLATVAKKRAGNRHLLHRKPGRPCLGG